MKRCLIFFCTFLIAFGTAPGQQEPVTFTSNTTLVIIDVSVKDKDGKIIEDLKKNDFTLTEDGKQQQIAVFDFQKLDNQNPAPVPAVKGEATTPAKPAAISGAIVQTAQPAPLATNVPAPVATKPGVAKPIIRYQDRRLVALLFDFSTMDIPEQIRVQKTAIDFIHQDLKPADLV
jgi:VWFA-related protein